MTATMYERGSFIAIHVTPQEYDIIAQALLLMSWSGFGIENNEEKIKRLENMKEVMNNLTVKFQP